MALGRPSCDTMRPVSQNPLSVTETNCSPSGATRMAEKPPKSANVDVNSRPPRYSSWPKRRSSGASGLNAVMDLAVTVMGTGESRPPRWAAAGHANAAAAPATTRPNLRRPGSKRPGGAAEIVIPRHHAHHPAACCSVRSSITNAAAAAAAGAPAPVRASLRTARPISRSWHRRVPRRRRWSRRAGNSASRRGRCRWR